MKRNDEFERINEITQIIEAFANSSESEDKGFSEEIEEWTTTLLYALRHIVTIMSRERLGFNRARSNKGLKEWTDIQDRLRGD